MVSAVLGYRPVLSRLIPVRLIAVLALLSSYRFMLQDLDTMTIRLTTSISNARKSSAKHLRRTFLYKRIGMLKYEGMHRQTVETYGDPTAMLRQTSESSDF